MEYEGNDLFLLRACYKSKVQYQVISV